MEKTVDACDLFCGAGGTSSGLYDACQSLGQKLNLLAINHWNLAIETHLLNHPYARHMCETLDSVDPRKEVPSGRLRIMVASPECTNHTDAKTNAPKSEMSRSTAWHVCRWAEALRIEDILIENVHQFEKWGPLDNRGNPIKSRQGETFKAFLNALVSLGYNLEYRRLIAANYGDPTTRERLFIMARRGRRRIVWPEFSHTEDGSNGTKKWVPARDVIDWKLKGTSIFNRPVPISKNTLRRIKIGLEKQGNKAEPFLVMLYGTGTTRSIDRPMPTITAKGNHIALCEPFLIKYYGTATAVSIDEPLDTVTTLDRFGLVVPEGGDILFRVLQPHELAKAMSLEAFTFKGTRREKIMQIGNAVCRRTARALCTALLAS